MGNNGGGTVSVIDTADNAVVAALPALSPYGVGISPDGELLCVANGGNNSVSVIRTSDNAPVDLVPTGGNSLHCDFTPDGAFLYVTNYGSDNVSVIQTSDFTVVDPPVAVGTGPVGVAIGAPPVPVATLSLNAACFRVGDPLQLDLRLLTAGATPPGGAYCFELKWWLETPLAFPADRISLANLAGPGNALCLPPAFDRTIRIVDLPVPADLSAGNYRFGVRQSDPIGGRTLGLSLTPFEVESARPRKGGAEGWPGAPELGRRFH